MNIEEKTNQLIEQFKKKMRDAAEDVLESAYCDILPHAEFDTFQNVQIQLNEAAKNLLIGRLERDGEQVVISASNGMSVRLSVTNEQWDLLRDSLIKAMPACPKDKKIAALEAENARLIEQYSRTSF